MRRIVWGVLVLIVIIGVVFMGWTLWKGFVHRQKASMYIHVGLRDELDQTVASQVVGNDTVTFQMPPNRNWYFPFSLHNNGTVPLHNVTMKIENISEGLILGIRTPVYPSYTRSFDTLYPKEEGDAFAWSILSPSQPGNYEIIFNITSDKVRYRFTVIIIVG